MRTPIDLVVLAAGNSRRFGSCKMLAPFENKRVIDRILHAGFSLPIASINVVIGAYAGEMRTYLEQHYANKLQLIFNQDWKRGMGASIACASKALNRNNALLIALGDQAFIKQEDLIKLINTWRKKPAAICCAHYKSQLGVPAIFPASYREQLIALTGGFGAKHIIANATANRQSVTMENAGSDIDSPKDLPN